jgi:putative flippase GtrA
MQLMKLTTLAILLATSAVLISAAPLPTSSTVDVNVHGAAVKACVSFANASPVKWTFAEKEECRQAAEIVAKAAKTTICSGVHNMVECLVVAITAARDLALSNYLDMDGDKALAAETSQTSTGGGMEAETSTGWGPAPSDLVWGVTEVDTCGLPDASTTCSGR